MIHIERNHYIAYQQDGTKWVPRGAVTVRREYEDSDEDGPMPPRIYLHLGNLEPGDYRLVGDVSEERTIYDRPDGFEEHGDDDFGDPIPDPSPTPSQEGLTS